MSALFTNIYTPDVLNCIANLSNDEVFTPPEIANKMLDLLPQELFENPDTKFLDPACKSGVFLREIAKRLNKGLKKKIPDFRERVDHIFKNQIYGIAITELTSLLSRRTLYCSKYANCKYSVVKFENVDGNIRYKRIPHTFQKGKCVFCGASEAEYGNEKRGDTLETHAYEFIHTTKPEEIWKMKFDVIIGNPPYQLGVGNTSGNSSKSKSIYHYFIEKSIKLNPRYLVMITPSRWMTRTTEGIPDLWVDNMIEDKRLKIIHDFLDSSQIFPGVEIKGGVNYFLWDRDYNGKCHYYLHNGNDDIVEPHIDYLNSMNTGIVIRDVKALDIIHKVIDVEGEYISEESKNFTFIVSPKDFFTNKQNLTSSWKGYSIDKTDCKNIKYYLNKNIHRVDYAWISIDDVPKNHKSIACNKVYIPAAGGTGNDSQVLGYPFLGDTNSCCSQTYLVIGYNSNYSENECENIISYIKTKFFRYLVSIKKKTQNGPRGVYQFVPLQDFSKPWTDAELYAKYNLTQEEIDFIESMIKPMDLGGGE